MAKAKAQMKRPAAEAVWTARLGWVDFGKVWKIRADYVSPRDQVAWLKVMHRNLRVAASGGLGSTQCMAQREQQDAEMQRPAHPPLHYSTPEWTSSRAHSHDRLLSTTIFSFLQIKFCTSFLPFLSLREMCMDERNKTTDTQPTC